MRLKIVPEDFENGGPGYRAVLTGEEGSGEVSVQDYLDALNDAIIALDLFRARGTENRECKGCDTCCGERMPLTAIDLINLAKSPIIREIFKEKGGSGEEILIKMIKRFCHIYVSGRAVDITLRLGADGKCPFLNRQSGTCSLYDFRPFVCQTYICCPASQEALELREAVVNAGEDELVRIWLNYAREAGIFLWYDAADAPEVDLKDWTPGSFTGKEAYHQILLKEVLSPDLLAKLHRTG